MAPFPGQVRPAAQERPLHDEPAIAGDALASGTLGLGNLRIDCRPSLVVASRSAIGRLVSAGYTEGAPEGLYQDRGVVLLVKKGNSEGIRSVFDLARPGVRLVTPNPRLEPGALPGDALRHRFERCASSAGHDRCSPQPGSLVDLLFNGTSGDALKWLAGPRIHHRDLPWSIALGQADAAVLLYHLGRFAQETFPGLLEVVPLGGSVDDPRPLPGTQIGVRDLVRLKGTWTPRQLEAREKLVEALLSEEFSAILARRSLERPVGFAPDRTVSP